MFQSVKLSRNEATHGTSQNATKPISQGLMNWWRGRSVRLTSGRFRSGYGAEVVACVATGASVRASVRLPSPLGQLGLRHGRQRRAADRVRVRRAALRLAEGVDLLLGV